jgi:glycosyltransferase involved in cell wall biosynthesis
MTVKPLLSLVIPFYKAERYLLNCLESVASQLRERCEVILVDDCSPDNCAALIRERYAAFLASGKFRLIRIHHSGLGAARNAGVRASDAEYIGFLDSDDFLFPGYFDRILQVVSTGGVDIIQFHCRRIRTSGDHGVLIRSHSAAPGRYKLQSVRNEIFGVGRWFACVRVYRRELLIGYPFPQGVFYEDRMTIPLAFMDERDIALLDDIFIGYRENVGSITHNHTHKHASDLLRFFRHLCERSECVPMNILKIQVGRTLSYFAAELGMRDLPKPEIIRSITSISNKREVHKFISFPDRLFLYFPQGYMILDKIRHWWWRETAIVRLTRKLAGRSQT